MSKAFLDTFESVTISIPFNLGWKNGTGYLDHAVRGEEMPVIPTGMTVKTIDDCGRKILLISASGADGQQASNVVIFERYTDGEYGIVVSNAATEMRRKYDFLCNGSISEENFRKFHFC